MKFKVGDKVKFIKWGMIHLGPVKLGEVYTIALIDNSSVPYQIENGEWFRENELELVVSSFTKSDLKDGDIVTYRNRLKRTVKGAKLIDDRGGISLYLNNFKDDLKDKDGSEGFDIIKVERPTEYETVFERKEDILDETERKYLSQVINPFRDKVLFIKKVSMAYTSEKFINIELTNGDCIDLPRFEEGTMYRKMEDDREYSLEKLKI